jgi:hypothetical protein
MLCPIPWGTSFRTLPHAHFKLPEHAMLQGVAGGGDPCCLARFPDLAPAHFGTVRRVLHSRPHHAPEPRLQLLTLRPILPA